jgi:hypothetical protein
MEEKSNASSELTGGTGFTFEDAVAAVYLSAMLGESTAPGVVGGKIVHRVALQQKPNGHPLDDLVIDVIDSDLKIYQVELQVKRSIVVSAADSNTEFKECIKNAYLSILKPSFQLEYDRVGIAVGEVSAHSRRIVERVCELTKASTDKENFNSMFSNHEKSSEEQRDFVTAIKRILSENFDGIDIVDGTYQLLRHFIIPQFDFMHEGAASEGAAVVGLQYCLHPENKDAAYALWSQIRTIARDSSGNKAILYRKDLFRKIPRSFRLNGMQSLRQDLARIKEESARAIAEISNEIDGVSISRESYLAETEALFKNHTLIQISGLPGTGKSAILRALGEKYLAAGPILFLKADRLLGSNWASHAQLLGIKEFDLQKFLLEIGLVGTAIIFIDGLDRIEIKNRPVIVDLLNTIQNSDDLKQEWKIAYTVRDNGLEPIRTWIPEKVFKNRGVATLNIGTFSGEEAQALAKAKPELSALLFGNDNVREITRRPFFAAVIGRSIPTAEIDSPKIESEIGLINAWWLRGGYGADGSRLLHRQHTLTKLAKLGANTYGRRIPLEGLNLDAINDLRDDGILSNVIDGHSVRFTHDIFFEWAFFRVLIAAENGWHAEISAVGEPPILGRVVELLSQNKLAEIENWESNLSVLENGTMRPQWKRAWLLGPLGSPRFFEYEEGFSTTVFKNNAQRFLNLCVWFQAEKTKGNPYILDGTLGTKSLSQIERSSLADSIAWPADIDSWKRCCAWILKRKEILPPHTLPAILSVFEVWQNLMADHPNAISRNIVNILLNWLEAVENYRHPENFSSERDGDNLPKGDLEEYEYRIRSLVLRAGRAYPMSLKGYLDRITLKSNIRSQVLKDILSYSQIICEKYPSDLVNLLLAELIEELPMARRARLAAEAKSSGHRGGMYQLVFNDGGYSIHDWKRLSISGHQESFYMPSPLREPFPSLFRENPTEAIRLVRELLNHAISSWRELFLLEFRIGQSSRKTPLPLNLEFPFGNQIFWGDHRVYLWFRGQSAPDVIESGLMALEEWALSEVDKGRNADEIIQELLQGQHCCAILGIAISVALYSKKISSTTLTLVSSQVLWNWDTSRYAKDRSGVHLNMFGFSVRPQDLNHAKAVQVLNNHPVRQREIRWLGMHFLLSPNEFLKSEYEKAVKNFSMILPFEFEEDAKNEELVRGLQERAKIWSELGDFNNLSITPTEDGKNVIVRVDSPTASGPESLHQLRSAEEFLLYNSLAIWAQKSLADALISDTFTLSNAISKAKDIDFPELFLAPHGMMGHDNDKRNAVSGVAAVALCLGTDLEDVIREWAQDIVLRSSRTKDEEDELFYEGSEAMFHPCLFSIYGLSLIVRTSASRSLDTLGESRETLVRLLGHPRMQISTGALTACLNLWDIDAHFSWNIFKLWVEVSIESHDGSHAQYGYAAYQERLNKAIDRYLSETWRDNSIVLPELPNAWAPYLGASTGPVSKKRSRSIEFGWQEPDVFLRSDILLMALRQFPLKQALLTPPFRVATLNLLEGLINWTVDSISPSWATARFKADAPELFEWNRIICRIIADASLELNIEEVQDRYLNRIFSSSDDAAVSLLDTYADQIARHVIFLPQIPQKSIPLLQLCLKRVLLSKGWDSARSRDGRIYGDELSRLIRTFLFIRIENVLPSGRFGNSNWSEISKIMPLIDDLVTEVGDIREVTSSFITLCENAFEWYPLSDFIRHITRIVLSDSGGLPRWASTTIPSRVASLIQRFAEKAHPLDSGDAQALLRILDVLVDMGDRRSSALQVSEIFKDVRNR